MRFRFTQNLFICLLSVCLASCSASNDQDTPTYMLPKNPSRLIAGDSSKIWKIARRFNNRTRMNMGDCFLSHRETFYKSGKMHDNSGEHMDCGPTLHATWELAVNKRGDNYIKLSSDQIPELLNVEEDFKLFKIMYLSEQEMRLQFKHRQFSNKWTTITDIYVPDSANVEGREFHW